MLSSIEAGARALLEDAADVLSDFKESEHVIVGGWCPVYRNKLGPKHPGTLDVDILFRESSNEGYLSSFMKKLIGRGFYPSAKHSFQYLKVQKIAGRKFVYNIDLLHPRMTEDITKLGLYVDHLELNVPLNDEEIHLKTMQSIALPNSEVLFKERLYTEELAWKHRFNLVTFQGMFITKMDSCQKPKRERDAFDIYLAFINEQIPTFELERIAEREKRIGRSLEGFKKYLTDKASEFDKNVTKYCCPIEPSPAAFILRELKG